MFLEQVIDDIFKLKLEEAEGNLKEEGCYLVNLVNHFSTKGSKFSFGGGGGGVCV